MLVGELSRSANMSRIRYRDTRTEIELRRVLWGAGLRYRLRWDLPGRPDLIFARPRVAVFVDGCFWHGCPSHYSGPASHSQFWAAKPRANVERDLRVNEDLKSLGWCPVHIWQHELKDTVRVLQRVRGHLDEVPPCEIGAGGSDLATAAPWYRCRCGSDEVRVLSVSDPGSLRLKAGRRPSLAEIACVTCRGVVWRQTAG